nr:nephrin-like isoform X1 [Lepeophtheirus salmonis]
MDTGEIVKGYLGPFQIGSRLSLNCQVKGGKPPPNLIWYRDEVRLLASAWESYDSISDTRITNNNLTIISLERSDVHTKLLCQSWNYPGTLYGSSVELDLIYQAQSVAILHKNNILKAGSQHQFTCESHGSRPPAVLSWWLDNEQFETKAHSVQITESTSGESTISTLMYTPLPEDTVKTLHCRATNPELLNGVIEDTWSLNVQYPPIVKIKLGASLIADDIRQGVDVYFKCIIKANPPPKTKIVTWLHNGEILKKTRGNDIRARLVLPSVNDPSVLVLQGVKKAARGNYSCVVGNGVPSHDHVVQSQPVFLDVKFPPVCKPQEAKVYGVAKMETAHIACNVEANPPDVDFRWTFNNSAEAKQVEERFINSSGFRSVLVFTPTRTLEYGTLMCWSSNSVGEQNAPCVFHIIAAGKPEAVQNCSIVNESTDSFGVNCSPGFNGGLPQHFTLAVYKVGEDQSRTLVANLSSPTPHFTVTGLEPGSNFIGSLLGHNVKGMGVPTTIRVYTLKLPEKLIPPIEPTPSNEDMLTNVEMSPLALTLLGIGSGIALVIILVMVAIRIHSSRQWSRRGNNNGPRRRVTEPHSSKVVVTTIEELDQLEPGSIVNSDVEGGSNVGHGSGASINNPDIVPFISSGMGEYFCKAEVHSSTNRSGSMEPDEYFHRRARGVSGYEELRNYPSKFTRNAGIDYCTLRRPPSTSSLHANSRRAVQFADQQMIPDVYGGTEPLFPLPPPLIRGGEGVSASNFMYATLRPGQSSSNVPFHEFVPPPPPPMFESSSVATTSKGSPYISTSVGPSSSNASSSSGTCTKPTNNPKSFISKIKQPSSSSKKEDDRDKKESTV